MDEPTHDIGQHRRGPAQGLVMRIAAGVLAMALGWYVPSHASGHFDRHATEGQRDHNGSGCALCLLAAAMSAAAPPAPAPSHALLAWQSPSGAEHTSPASRLPGPYYRRGPPVC